MGGRRRQDHRHWSVSRRQALPLNSEMLRADWAQVSAHHVGVAKTATTAPTSAVLLQPTLISIPKLMAHLALCSLFQDFFYLGFLPLTSADRGRWGCCAYSEQKFASLSAGYTCTYQINMDIDSVRGSCLPLKAPFQARSPTQKHTNNKRTSTSSSSLSTIKAGYVQV